jgi:hypothetical protein
MEIQFRYTASLLLCSEAMAQITSHELWPVVGAQVLRHSLYDHDIGQRFDSLAFDHRGSARTSRHSRLCSSIRLSIRTVLPSFVLPPTKSYDRTWIVCSGRSRTHDPSLSHSLPLGFCLFGTFSPSRRQIRSTRSFLTFQPASTSNAVIRR